MPLTVNTKGKYLTTDTLTGQKTVTKFKVTDGFKSGLYGGKNLYEMFSSSSNFVTIAVLRTAVLMLGLMIFESECGFLSGILSLGIQLIYAIAPIIITCIGISIVIKSIFKG